MRGSNWLGSLPRGGINSIVYIRIGRFYNRQRTLYGQRICKHTSDQCHIWLEELSRRHLGVAT